MADDETPGVAPSWTASCNPLAFDAYPGTTERRITLGDGKSVALVEVHSPWTDDELWALYETDPKAHALAHLVLRTVKDANDG